MDHKVNQHGHDSRMMWVMMIGCTLPVLLILLSNPGSFSPLSWVVIVAVVAMIGFHIWGMIKSKRGKDKPLDSQPSENQSKHHYNNQRSN
ncbi:MAG: hypothetical protein A2722_04115 [Candidatus Doudnabacteria bacterium RIFCSPHIGHO2_01_FULL_50_11]|uniref:DUF2933 domain-containing protein n=1 Tax=Candidatus Doudnabacteria bacterium RIFCSPHIGHO2_01_FULL_50_11 TaxID=1817828 RepID=A0A1F5PFT5_9BACT|nr:MAG: hypothetical protein A2722_04115 [Candidatus Doudnabacteria bacterium RIFCSPHIGHO2_01_FULL_50_11]HLC45153.1 hypothetical protein [Patescibacteria group bacterium]